MLVSVFECSSPEHPKLEMSLRLGDGFLPMIETFWRQRGAVVFFWQIDGPILR
jgi:hypothetical protein